MQNVETSTFCSCTFLITVIDTSKIMVLFIVLLNSKLIPIFFYYCFYVAKILYTYVKRDKKHILFMYFFWFECFFTFFKIKDFNNS